MATTMFNNPNKTFRELILDAIKSTTFLYVSLSLLLARVILGVVVNQLSK
jgi:hypothetical protein